VVSTIFADYIMAMTKAIGNYVYITMIKDMVHTPKTGTSLKSQTSALHDRRADPPKCAW